MYKKILLIVVSFVAALGAIYFLETTEAQTPPPSISGRFYKFDVVAEDLGFNPRPPTINKGGTVAFVTRASEESNFEQIFARKVNGQLTTVTSPNVPNFVSRYFSYGVQLNDANKIVANSWSRTDGASFYELRIWDATQLESSTPVATALNSWVGDPPITYDWVGSMSYASINNLGQPVFLNYNLGATRLTSGIRPDFSSVNGAYGIPFIDDGGNIVLKDVTSSGSPIRLYPYNLGTSTNIATVSSTTFSDLGDTPGISDLGQVVAFYGNLATGANAGPGIYLSIPQSSGARSIIKVNGVKNEMAPLPGQIWPNVNGVCDAGEPCYGDLGLDSANNPLFLSSFQSDSRIGISHQSLGATGLDGDVLVLCFLATPNSADNNPTGYFSNQLGVWSQRVLLKSVGGVIRTFASRPIPVIQEGDNLDGGQITGLLAFYDPIARVTSDSQGNARTDKPAIIR